jgi:hypothetical protein
MIATLVGITVSNSTHSAQKRRPRQYAKRGIETSAAASEVEDDDGLGRGEKQSATQLGNLVLQRADNAAHRNHRSGCGSSLNSHFARRMRPRLATSVHRPSERGDHES